MKPFVHAAHPPRATPIAPPFRLAEPAGWRHAALMLAGLAGLLGASLLQAQEPARWPLPEAAWMNHPMTLEECTALALQQNGDVVRARLEFEASSGVSLQIRSVALPVVKATGEYLDYRSRTVEALPFPLPSASHLWTASIRVVQPVYDGGRLHASVKIAALTRQEALSRFQAIASDKILEVRTAYFDILLAEARVKAEQSSLDLRSRQLEDVRRQAGTGIIDRHELLRSEVERARVRQKLLRAQNQLHIGQVKFVQLLGFAVPGGTREMIPLQLADTLVAPPSDPIDLSSAIERALQDRPEIEAQAQLVRIETERLSTAQSGYKPSVHVLGGYGGFNDDLDRKVTGWFAGAQVNWNLFDGLHTRGKVREARARLAAAESRLAGLKRAVALEVRVAHSSVGEARELIDTEAKVREMAEEGLRLAASSHRAGGVSSVDVLAAEHAAMESRFTALQALRDYNVALAGLERAMGLSVAGDTRAAGGDRN